MQLDVIVLVGFVSYQFEGLDIATQLLTEEGPSDSLSHMGCVEDSWVDTQIEILIWQCLIIALVIRGGEISLIYPTTLEGISRGVRFLYAYRNVPLRYHKLRDFGSVIGVVVEEFLPPSVFHELVI